MKISPKFPKIKIEYNDYIKFSIKYLQENNNTPIVFSLINAILYCSNNTFS